MRDIAVYDPIAQIPPPSPRDSCTATQADHRVAFWIQTGTGQMVINARPLPIVVSPAIRQGNTVWATQRYAPLQVDAYLNSLEPNHPEKEDLETAIERTINLRQKGCLLSSYAMALNTMFDRSDLTTESMHSEFNAAFSGIIKNRTVAGFPTFRTGVLLWRRSGSGDPIPSFNGADALHALIWGAYGLTGLPIETPVSSQGGRVVVRREEIIAAHNLGNPVLLNVEGGGHWVVSKGALGCDNKGETLFDIVDPGDSSGAHDGPRTLSQLRCKKAIILKRRDQDFPASQATLLGLRNLPTPSEIPLYVQTIGAVNVMVITSKGQRTGFDAASGQNFSEIPGAVLLPEFPIGTPEAPYTEEESKSLEEVCGRLIALSGRPGESLAVKLTGKAPTEYAVFLGGGNLDQRIPPQVVSGKLVAGESTTIPFAVNSALPTLQITKASNTAVILSWPTSFSGFKLQAATNGSVPFVWFDLKDSPNTVLDRYVISQPVSGSITLFRLLRQ